MRLLYILNIKSIALGIFLITSTIVLLGQQQEHYSMYMQNNFLVNPAEGGTDDFTDLKLGYRTQWVGFGGGPRTSFLSVHTPVGKNNPSNENVMPLAFHGVGGAVIADDIGPFRILTAKLAYAYHLPVNRSLILSIGTFIGIKQFELNENDLNFSSDASSTDPFANSFQKSITPDMSLGLWGYSKKYYFGIASFQLLNSKVSLYENSQANSSLAAHHWVTGGYKVPIDSNWFLVPSVVLKYVKDTPLTFDLNAKLRYQDKYWLGASYRKEDALVLLAGVTIKKTVDLAYSYDVTQTKIKLFSSGSHEIVLGWRLPAHETKPAPAQFW